MTVPILESGDLYKLAPALWSPIYEARFRDFGNTTTIIPLVDPTTSDYLPATETVLSRINSTTHKTVVYNASGSAQTVTWSTAPSAMGTPFTMTRANRFAASGLHGPSLIPGLALNGTTERWSIPDAAYWTPVIATKLSYVFCCLAVNTATQQALIAKVDDANVAREFFVKLLADETFVVILYDQVAVVSVQRASNAAVPLLTPIHIAFTWDGSVGATAMDSAVIYINGAAVASTATNNASFVQVRDGALNLGNAYDQGGTPLFFWQGSMYGGPFGPTVVNAQLTAAQVTNDWRRFRAAMGL